MITYNMRYRGPYEYDKLILNVFQYHNDILRLAHEIGDGTAGLHTLEGRVDLMAQQVTSICDQIVLFKEEVLTT